MSTYQERKAERTAEYRRNHGLKMITCDACSGSGYYDHNGSPPCGMCEGAGKVRESPPVEPRAPVHWRDALAAKNHLEECRRRLRETSAG